MYVCMHVCMYVCIMYVCMYVCMYVDRYVYINIKNVSMLELVVVSLTSCLRAHGLRLTQQRSALRSTVRLYKTTASLKIECFHSLPR